MAKPDDRSTQSHNARTAVADVRVNPHDHETQKDAKRGSCGKCRCCCESSSEHAERWDGQS